jgi:hypothetical protein
MNQHERALTLAEFRAAVRDSVLRRLGEEAGPVRASEDGAEYARGALTVRVSEQHGAALMTYVAAPTAAFGHTSSAGLPQPLRRENIELIANEVAARLTDQFLHRTQ